MSIPWLLSALFGVILSSIVLGVQLCRFQRDVSSMNADAIVHSLVTLDNACNFFDCFWFDRKHNDLQRFQEIIRAGMEATPAVKRPNLLIGALIMIFLLMVSELLSCLLCYSTQVKDNRKKFQCALISAFHLAVECVPMLVPIDFIALTALELLAVYIIFHCRSHYVSRPYLLHLWLLYELNRHPDCTKKSQAKIICSRLREKSTESEVVLNNKNCTFHNRKLWDFQKFIGAAGGLLTLLAFYFLLMISLLISAEPLWGGAGWQEHLIGLIISSQLAFHCLLIFAWRDRVRSL